MRGKPRLMGRGARPRVERTSESWAGWMGSFCLGLGMGHMAETPSSQYLSAVQIDLIGIESLAVYV